MMTQQQYFKQNQLSKRNAIIKQEVTRKDKHMTATFIFSLLQFSLFLQSFFPGYVDTTLYCESALIKLYT